MADDVDVVSTVTRIALTAVDVECVPAEIDVYNVPERLVEVLLIIAG